MQFGVLGLIITTLVTQLLVNIIMLYWIGKHYELTVDWRFVGKNSSFLRRSCCVNLRSYLGAELLQFNILLILGVVFFTIVFIAATLLTQTISKSDIENLRGMISGLGSIGKIINRVLNILEKIVDILKH